MVIFSYETEAHLSTPFNFRVDFTNDFNDKIFPESNSSLTDTMLKLITSFL